MPAGQLSATKAPGQVTIGTDSTGKHYKYESGAGRGRKPLNLTPRQSAGLRSLGLQPRGGRISISATQMAQLGIGGAQSPAAQRQAALQGQGQRTAGASPGVNRAAMRGMVEKILGSHNTWARGGDVKDAGTTHARLQKLFANGRGEMLKKGNVSEAHKALAAAVLGTIFNKGVNLKPDHERSSNSQFKVLFNPGNGESESGHITLRGHDGKHLASVHFNDITKIDEASIDKIRNHFDRANGAKTPQQVTQGAKDKAAGKPTDEIAAIKSITKAVGDKPKPSLHAQAKSKGEILPGGKGDKKPDSAFKGDALKKGMKVESEHTKNKGVQKEIAKDHLTEDPKYYDKLKKMEGKTSAPKKQENVAQEKKRPFGTVRNPPTKAEAKKSEAPKTEGAAPNVTHTFKTSKGSTYKFHEGGSTTRNKSDHSGDLSLHEKTDVGEKKRSARTIFVHKDAATHLSGAGLTDVGGKGHHLVIKDNKATLVSWNKKENKWGATASGRDVEFSTEPKVGMSPVEVWDKHDKINGMEAYSNQHAGNEIVELTPTKKSETPKAEAPKTPASKAGAPKAEAPKPAKTKKEKPATAVNEPKLVATQIAMGGSDLHPLAKSLRERKEDVLKISAKGHKKLIETYNQHATKGHKAAMDKVWEQVKRIADYHDLKRNAEKPKAERKKKK